VIEHDVLVGFRLRLFTLAEELGNVSEACRVMGVDRSTYYRLKAKVDRWGLEALDVRERRRPRMPNQIGPHLEQRIVAFSLGHPAYGPRRISAELAREKWGAIRISEHGVWRVLCRVGLNTRTKRLALIARHRDPYERKPDPPPPARHIDATEPGEKVQIDCFYVGRLSGTKGTVWQYTAIDVASAYTWAELHATERNPRARHTRELLHRVAAELAAAGWKLHEVTTDNGSEFRAREFRDTVTELGARQRFIRAGRPNSNGCVERVQLTILEECWRPAFARSLVPKSSALSQDLHEYLIDYG
jgi:transposase InsO family protein